MGTWSISPNKYASIDENGLATFEKNEDGVGITYTITYTDEYGNCGSAQIYQPGDCSSGGGGNTCKGNVTITAKNGTADFDNGGELSTDEATLTFEHSHIDPEPTPTPTGGWSADDDPMDVISIAKSNADDGNLTDWRPYFATVEAPGHGTVTNALLCRSCPNGENECYYNDGLGGEDYYNKRDVITIKIVNGLNGLYIPFNAGKFRINGKYTCFRGVTKCGNGTLSWRYGSKNDVGFDSNFIIPPGKTVTLNNCYVFSNASSDGRSIIGFSLLKSSEGDYELHGDDAGTQSPTEFGVGFNYDIHTKTATFNITGGTWWAGERHYALTSEDVQNGYVKFKSGSNGYIVPIHLGKVANGTWSYTSDSAYAQTLPEGMLLS